MNKTAFAAVALVAGLGLSACQSEQADQVEDAAEDQAEAIDDQADMAGNEMVEDTLEDQADAVEAQGEEAADAMDDDGEVAPSEVPGGQ